MANTSAKAFYVTTPIYYVTVAPSIGNAYTTVIGDVLTRWHRQRGERVWYLTGTDEHGQKVMRAAAVSGQTPQEWTDQLVETAWKPVLDTIDAANDQFIRTTDPGHMRQVQEFWERVRVGGDVYEGRYEGPYCVGCEEFKLPADIAFDAEGIEICPIHGTSLELVSESNYFFAMSKYAQRLLDLYEQRPDFVQPESARNEVISFVKQGLEDLSISRSSFDWGIPVPWDTSQVFYVWIDALLNYLTAAGYGEDEQRLQQLWPADIHLVGKDILRFHAVIWPAMLLAAGLEVPHHVFAHGWLLVGGQKMSKSKVTAIAPDVVTDHFGSDAYRYYFTKTIAFGSDASFSWEHLNAVYHSDLANGLGNLASRVTAMVAKYFDGVLPAPAADGPAEHALAQALSVAAHRADDAIDTIAPHEAVTAVADFVGVVNGYLTAQQPWTIAGDESPDRRGRLATILYAAAESLRAVAVLHNAVMPKTCAALWEALGASEFGPLIDQRVQDAGGWGQLPPGVKLTKGQSLFPRLPDEAT
ncbi:MAG: methionine--tRNA ligase [Nocardioidaceae bacterium]